VTTFCGFSSSSRRYYGIQSPFERYQGTGIVAAGPKSSIRIAIFIPGEARIGNSLIKSILDLKTPEVPLAGGGKNKGPSSVRIKIVKPPQLVASFIPSQACNVCYWHLADNTTAPAFVRYWTKADKGGFWPATVCPLMTHQRHSGGMIAACRAACLVQETF